MKEEAYVKLKELYQLQKKLDERIDYNKEDRIDCKFLALLVELGELANETQCFKFWKVGRHQHKHDRPTTVEEYVDCFHFILSLGIEYGWKPNELHAFSPEWNDWDIVKQFDAIFYTVTQLKYYQEYFLYEQLMQQFLGLGQLMLISEKEIYDAYLAKNEINHERQECGY